MVKLGVTCLDSWPRPQEDWELEVGGPAPNVDFEQYIFGKPRRKSGAPKPKSPVGGGGGIPAHHTRPFLHRYRRTQLEAASPKISISQ